MGRKGLIYLLEQNYAYKVKVVKQKNHNYDCYEIEKMRL